MSGTTYTDCPCGQRFHDSEWEAHWEHPRAEVERLKDQIRVLVEAMLNAQVEIPTGTYPINGPLTMKMRTELEREVMQLRAAVSLFTSHNHLCGTRPCSCGAYTSLVDALSGQ